MLVKCKGDNIAGSDSLLEACAGCAELCFGNTEEIAVSQGFYRWG